MPREDEEAAEETGAEEEMAISSATGMLADLLRVSSSCEWKGPGSLRGGLGFRRVGDWKDGRGPYFRCPGSTWDGCTTCRRRDFGLRGRA